MPTPEEFLEATKYMGIATLTMAGITLLAFLLGWGFRFRLVGITSFMGVLTGGLLGLSFEPFTPTVVPGSVPYKTVYDSGSSQIVIKVPDTITPTELELTLRQAARNLLKPSRMGGADLVPNIRARTIVHESGGVSNLVYLGKVQPDYQSGPNNNLSVTIFDDAFSALPDDSTADTAS